ncbi:hypothetical protein FRC07_014645, partial [Ceratobasidium sp. 392]
WPALTENTPVHEMIVTSFGDSEPEDMVMESPEAQFSMDDYRPSAQAYMPVKQPRTPYGPQTPSDEGQDSAESYQMAVSPDMAPVQAKGHASKPSLGQNVSPTGHLSHARGSRPMLLGQAGPSTVSIDAARAQAQRAEDVQTRAVQARKRLSFTVARVLEAREHVNG